MRAGVPPEPVAAGLRGRLPVVGYGDFFDALLVVVSVGIALMAVLVVYRLFRGQS